MEQIADGASPSLDALARARRAASSSTTSAPATRRSRCLSDLPVDGLKIDRSFTAALGQEASMTKVTVAIIDLAHALDLQVVAEGIESLAVLDLLVELDCAYGQGFHLGRPALPAAIAELFETADPSRARPEALGPHGRQAVEAERLRHLGAEVVALRLGGEGAGAHVGGVGGEGLDAGRLERRRSGGRTSAGSGPRCRARRGTRAPARRSPARRRCRWSGRRRRR